MIRQGPAIAQPARGALPAEGRLLLHNVSWQAYDDANRALALCKIRMTYDRGSLELMTPLSRHDMYKHWLGRLVEAIAEEMNVEIAPAGSTTLKREDLARGLEPDECFWIANEPRMRGKLDLDLRTDPPPDLAIEIDITSSSLDRMSIYAALGVPEVWRFDGESLRVSQLAPEGTYRSSPASSIFPAVPLEGIVQFLHPAGDMGYLGVIRAFRAWVREQLDQQ